MFDSLRRAVRRRRWTAAVMVALGYSLVLAGASIGGIGGHPVQEAGPPVLFVGVSIMAAGVFWLLARAARARGWANETARGTIALFTRIDGPGQLPRPGDVSQVIGHATQRINPSLFYDTEQLNQYLDINPGALRVLRNDAAAPTRLTGYYVLLGLSPRAEELIRYGAIDVGVAITPSLTVYDPGAVDALYLGMVQGFGAGGKNAAILALIDHILGIVQERNGGPIRVYARRGNPSSGKLMDDLGFAPVLQPGGIEVTEVPNPGVQAIRENRQFRIAQSKDD